MIKSIDEELLERIYWEMDKETMHGRTLREVFKSKVRWFCSNGCTHYKWWELDKYGFPIELIYDDFGGESKFTNRLRIIIHNFSKLFPV